VAGRNRVPKPATGKTALRIRFVIDCPWEIVLGEKSASESTPNECRPMIANLAPLNQQPEALLFGLATVATASYGTIGRGSDDRPSVETKPQRL